jgi:hypothetical protein
MDEIPQQLPTEKETMRQKEIESVKREQGDCIPPSHAVQNAICDAHDQSALPGEEPTPGHDPHVSVLVVFVCFGVPRRRPGECSSEYAVLDRGEISVGLDHHDELDVDGKTGFSPEAKRDEGVE